MLSFASLVARCSIRLDARRHWASIGPSVWLALQAGASFARARGVAARSAEFRRRLCRGARAASSARPLVGRGARAMLAVVGARSAPPEPVGGLGLASWGSLRAGHWVRCGVFQSLHNKRLHLSARGFGLAAAGAGGRVGASRRRCGFAAGRRSV